MQACELLPTTVSKVIGSFAAENAPRCAHGVLRRYALEMLGKYCTSGMQNTAPSSQTMIDWDGLPRFITPSIRLKGGGGDGGSIPGRYDLVDIKKSIMSSGRSGRYSSFAHNSMVRHCTTGEPQTRRRETVSFADSRGTQTLLPPCTSSVDSVATDESSCVCGGASARRGARETRSALRWVTARSKRVTKPFFVRAPCPGHAWTRERASLSLRRW